MTLEAKIALALPDAIRRSCPFDDDVMVHDEGDGHYIVDGWIDINKLAAALALAIER